MSYSTKIGGRYYQFFTETDMEKAKKLYTGFPSRKFEDLLEENCIDWNYDEFDPNDF